MIDFTYDYRENHYYGSNPESVPTEPQFVRPASTNQLATYRQICERKGVEQQDTSAWSSDQASAEINRLIAFKPASPAQLALIHKKLQHLQELEAPINIPDSEIKALTGGRDGTASKLIEQLITLEKQYSDRMTVSERQLETLVSWYLCPDIPFETFSVPLTKRLDEVVTLKDGSTKQLWRRLEPVEFAEEIQHHFNYQSASQFINDYRSVFHDWKRSRITKSQMQRVRTLESRLADISRPTFTELAIDMDGKPVIIQSRATDNKIASWRPTSYVPISDLELMMYDRKQASRLIAQLESEVKDRELTKSQKDEGADEKFELLRNLPTLDQVFDAEVSALRDSIYALMAVLGQREHDFEHDEPQLIVDRWSLRHQDKQVYDMVAYLEEMMVYAIDNEFITQEGLLKLGEKSRIATKIASASW